jgi:phosphoribosylformylglycinamidine synthase
MGLNDAEYRRICEVLGREPNYTEIGMYAVMWSEHCGYKYSRPVLRLFNTYREAADSGTMENAGVIPLSDGLGIVFKMESHNHPSAVEPFQGAATGVGGILRDIFTMGARPIACMDSLRFGDISDRRTRFLFNGVVEGIAFYGNCVGVPTVGGEVYFNPCYQGNPLVNAMAVGLVRTDKIATAAAKGIGNPVLLVGSRTGRDGIHACSVLASTEISEESLANRPAVQAGDPFTEKLLIEATLEALATGHIVGIQDMGAAGITCATCETAAKGDVGMRIDVLKIPRREEGMTHYEVMLSESLERMLAIVEEGHEDAVAAIFHKWGLNAVHVGEVTDDGFVTVMEGDALVARVPAKSLADECPTYTLDTTEPAYIKQVQGYDLSTLSEPSDLTDVLLRLLASPNIASKAWVWGQYDHMVQTNTVVLPGSDAAVLRIKPMDAGATLTEAIHGEAAHALRKGLAITTDCNSRYCYLDPYQGAWLAVAEAARNLSCSGAEPKGVTDCLNFANPEKPENFWQFRRAVEGLAAACEAFATPVVSGNVSFYNETPESAVYPTPTVGMVGVLEDVERRCVSAFQHAGDLIYLLGPASPAPEAPLDGIGGSEYLSVIHGLEVGQPPRLDVEVERNLQATLRTLINGGLLRSAHDVSDGGLAVALAESAIQGELGCGVRLPDTAPAVWQLFAEAQSRVIVTVSPEHASEAERVTAAAGVAVTRLGTVGGDRIVISGRQQPGNDAEELVHLSVSEAAGVWGDTLPNWMNRS